MGKPINLNCNFLGEIPPTGAAGATTYYPCNDGFNLICTSSLGLGVLRKANDTGAQLQFDATAEVAWANIYFPPILDPAQGFYMETKMRMQNIGDNAALDADWGLVSVIDSTTWANLDDATMTSGARFHMDGNSADIRAQSTGGASSVSSTDTTVDNSTSAYKIFTIQGDGNGVVKLSIAAAMVLTSTSFLISTTIPLGMIFNIEKSSDDTLAVMQIDYVRLTGVSI